MGKFSRKISEVLRRDDCEQISDYIVESCRMLSEEYQRQGKRMPNQENVIRNILLEEYLDNDKRRTVCNMRDYRFNPEPPEHYDGQGNYIGRGDIRIVLKTDFAKRDAYYLVECKRLDGSRRMNKEYVEEGVMRFTSQKYSAYYGKGFMLGFVVMPLHLTKNAREIEELQNACAEPSVHGKFVPLNISAFREVYRCVYQMRGGELELRHAFVDFSGIVE